MPTQCSVSLQAVVQKRPVVDFLLIYDMLLYPFLRLALNLKKNQGLLHFMRFIVLMWMQMAIF